MGRRIWDAAAGLSLLLFATAAVMWVSSYWYYDESGLRLGRHLLGASSAHGDTTWIWDTDYTGEPRSFARRVPLRDSIYAEGMAHYLEHRLAGFAARYHVDPPGTGPRTFFRVLAVPYWFVLLVTAAAPAYWLVITRRIRRRTARGHCLGCGYDLRASTGRCPECGRAF